jgi:hypothetical protein
VREARRRRVRVEVRCGELAGAEGPGGGGGPTVGLR